MNKSLRDYIKLVESAYSDQESMSAKLDSTLGSMAPQKPAQALDVRAKNAYARGFRGGFSETGDSTGIGKDVAAYFKAGMRDGAAERAKFNGEIPAPTVKKNIYGDRKPNQAYEKLVKGLMAPYLAKLTVK